MKQQMNLCGYRCYPLPSPTAAVATARELLRRSTPAAGTQPARPAVVWTPLEPSGYVRVGRRLLPARWCGLKGAPAVGDTVDLRSPVIRLLVPYAPAPDAHPGTYERRRGGHTNDGH